MCRGPECGDKRGSRQIYDAFRAAIADRGVDESVEMRWQSCFGRCTQGPNTLVREVVAPGPGSGDKPRFVFAALPSGRRTLTALYNRLTTEDAGALVDEHVIGGRIVRRLIERPVRTKTVSESADATSAKTGD